MARPKKKRKYTKRVRTFLMASQYMEPINSTEFKLITVYGDYSITIGCVQKFNQDKGPIRLHVEKK